MTRAVRASGIVAVLAAMLLGMLTLASPPAEAQNLPVLMNESFARLHAVPAGDLCPAGHTDAGLVSFATEFRWCTPDGYNRVVQTVAECEQAFLQLGQIAFDPTFSPAICFSLGGFLMPGQTCRPPAIAANTPTGRACLGPVFAIGGGGVVNSAQPICVEDAKVQDNEDLADHVVGSVFFDDEDVARIITTGTTSCAFNCIDGFDADCNDVIGDFCAVELNLNRVADVGTCLAALAPATTDAVVTAAPAVAQPVAIAVDSTLAHTGPSDVLPPVAFWLVGIGATTLAAAHHSRSRREQ